MNIGKAAALSGISAKTLRYYEEIGLVKPMRRRGNGYRDYDQQTIGKLCLIRRARNLGFSVEECRQFVEALDGENGAQTSRRLILERWEEKLKAKDRQLHSLLECICEKEHEKMRASLPEHELPAGDR